MERALEEHRKTPKSLGRVLIDLGYIHEADLVRALAEQVGLEFVDLTDYRDRSDRHDAHPRGARRRYRALPIGERDGKLLVAMSDPANVYALDDIRTITGPRRAARGRDRQRRRAGDPQVRGHGRSGRGPRLRGLEALETDDEQSRVGAVEDAPIVKLVQAIMTQAVTDRASDVHIEPTERDVRVRFRVDGVLHEVMHSPKNIQGGLISRLKVMADLNIAEKRVPQDGRISMRVGGKQLDLRVATLPTVYGEKIVIRILDKSQALLRLEDLGFLGRRLQALRGVVPQAVRSDPRDRPDRFGQVDHPVRDAQHRQRRQTATSSRSRTRSSTGFRGVNQMQVNPKAGLTFASALRSILRADPDIVLIGEIRDRETAMIAVESALTGHLVLSSLHTNDARVRDLAARRDGGRDVPGRLRDRLRRGPAARPRRCASGARRRTSPSTPSWWRRGTRRWLIPEIDELFRPAGCSACSNTGYRGRVGLYEVMPMSEEIERLTVDRASADEIRRTAIEQGMMTLRDDGLEKARMGLTSIERDREGGEVRW